MPDLLLLNPRKRTRRTRRASHESTAARSRAAKKGWRAKRKTNPITAHRRRVHRKLTSTSHHKRRRSYRRNPIRMGGIGNQLMGAAYGAMGAITLDVIMGKLPLPASMQSGVMHTLIKAIGAIALGMGVGAAGAKRAGPKVAEGALSVVFHDAIKTQLAVSMPTLTLGDTAIPYYPTPAADGQLGYYNGGMVVPDNFGEYVEDQSAGMGEYVNF